MASNLPFVPPFDLEDEARSPGPRWQKVYIKIPRPEQSSRHHGRDKTRRIVASLRRRGSQRYPRHRRRTRSARKCNPSPYHLLRTKEKPSI